MYEKHGKHARKCNRYKIYVNSFIFQLKNDDNLLLQYFFISNHFKLKDVKI